MAQNERQKTLEKIKGDIPRFNGEIILLIFNYKEEIKKADWKKIAHIMKDWTTNEAIIIYHGEGGDTNAGFGLAVVLRKKFHKSLIFFLPEKACSAHTIPVLLSNGLWMSKQAYLTPIHPSIYYNSKNYPCGLLLEDEKHPASKQAKVAFNNTANTLFEILRHEGSLIIDPSRLDSKTEDKIARYFLNPNNHNKQIDIKSLKEMKLEANLLDDDILQMVKKVHSMALIDLEKNNKRYLIETHNNSFML